MYYATTLTADPWQSQRFQTRITLWQPPVATQEIVVWTFPAAGDSNIARGVLRRLDARTERLRRIAARLGQRAADFALALQLAGARKAPLELRADAYPPQVTTTRSPGGARGLDPWAARLRAFVATDTFRRRRPKRIAFRARRGLLLGTPPAGGRASTRAETSR